LAEGGEIRIYDQLVSTKPGHEHLGVSPRMASLMRSALIEHYFRPRGEVTVYDPDDEEKKHLLAAWLGNDPEVRSDG
jgi:hypothetical protein